MDYERWDVVIVPFPFVDAPRSKHRPVVIISKVAFNKSAEQYIAAMITTAARSTWGGDVPIQQPKDAGLPLPSVVRFKLFTLDERLIVKRIGKLAEKDIAKVQKALQHILL